MGGGFYLVDPLKQPFGLPPPIAYTKEGKSNEKEWSNRYIGMFEVKGVGSLIGFKLRGEFTPVEASLRYVIDGANGDILA